MDNQEDILDALRDFEKKPPLEIPPVLEQYLGRVASTGETIFPWAFMKPLFVKKLDDVMQEFETETHMDSLPLSPNVENVKFDAIRRRILEAIDRFHGAPFTIQRLCELIMDPKKHYKRADKFLRGVEKNILVVSTVDPFGRKIVSESKSLVNGMDSNGHTQAEISIQEERVPSCTKSTPTGPETNWLSNEVASSLPASIPVKELFPTKSDTELEVGAGEGTVTDKNIEQGSVREPDHTSVADDRGDQTHETQQSKSLDTFLHHGPCQENVARDIQKWPVADSTQSCVKDSGDSLVLSDSQEAQSNMQLQERPDEEKSLDSDPNIHSDEALSPPFPEVLASTSPSDQSLPSAASPSNPQTCETSDSHTVVSSSEEDSESLEEIEKEEPSSTKMGIQDQVMCFSGTELPVTTTIEDNAPRLVETPEEGVSSSNNSESSLTLKEHHGQCENASSASAHPSEPDSQATGFKGEEDNNTNIGSTAELDDALSEEESERTEEESAAIGSCETIGSTSSSSDNSGDVMETEDSGVVKPIFKPCPDINPATSLENLSSMDEPMDQD